MLTAIQASPRVQYIPCADGTYVQRHTPPVNYTPQCKAVHCNNIQEDRTRITILYCQAELDFAWHTKKLRRAIDRQSAWILRGADRWSSRRTQAGRAIRAHRLRVIRALDCMDALRESAGRINLPLRSIHTPYRFPQPCVDLLV